MKAPKSNAPYLGFNSYDCWNADIDEARCLANIDAFARRLQPHGYEYFCLDAGWYQDGYFEEVIRKEAGSGALELDEFGRLCASRRKFPRGLKFVADACHGRGIKFGVHVMRGIPVAAVERNCRVKGTRRRAADIADRDNICIWCDRYYGVDMAKPGAQAYYDSVVEYLDESGVDFIKFDDAAEQPAEIRAFGKAVAKARRPIVLSLSPGNFATPALLPVYRKYADMVRITGDVWDRPSDLVPAFDRWEQWQSLGGKGLWLDLDMIPFGLLLAYISPSIPKEALPGGLNGQRMSRLTLAEKRTFITQRALAASPLFFGGELTMTPDEDIALATDATVLACNQNGVCARRIYGERLIDVRQAKSREDPGHGWLGVFNRRDAMSHRFSLPIRALRLPGGVNPSALRDTWTGLPLDVRGGRAFFDLQPFECRFIAY